MRLVLVPLFVSMLLACATSDDESQQFPTSCVHLNYLEVVITSNNQAEELAPEPVCLEGRLTISGDFTSLDAFANILEVGELEIANNRELESLSGLESVRVRHGLRVQDNPRLRSLEPLYDLPSSMESIVIRDNDALESIEVLEGVGDIGNNLEIGGAKLESLAGLENLVGISGDLTIRGTQSLRAIDGFSIVFGFIGGRVLIEDNQALEDISALEVLNHIGGRVKITGNPALSGCRASSFVQAHPSATVEDNGASWEPCYDDDLEPPQADDAELAGSGFLR